MKVMVNLAVINLFKNYYNLEPAKSQNLTALMILPWTPKLFYGIWIDTFPIFGSKMKSYIVLMGFIQGVAAILIATVPVKAAETLTVMVIVVAFSGAIMDVSIDAIMVV